MSSYKFTLLEVSNLHNYEVTLPQVGHCNILLTTYDAFPSGKDCTFVSLMLSYIQGQGSGQWNDTHPSMNIDCFTMLVAIIQAK